MTQDIMKEYGISIVEKNNKGRKNNFNCDCNVGMVKSGKSKQVVFSFYNGTANRIIGDAKYMTYGLNSDKSRVYFISATQCNGFKVSSDSNTHHVVRRNVQPSEYGMWESWKGYYYLRYDKRVNCYYIDIKEKFEEV